MHDITRRDLLNGMAAGAGLAALAPFDVRAEASASVAPYPPALTGLRGSHPGSYEAAHALAWRGDKPATYREIGEHYDLIVVGGGISGLAAARFYREASGPQARILVLDNHDDFGGHARRNEFEVDGRMVLGIGGAQNLERPGAYSDVARRLLADLGLDRAALEAVQAATPEDFLLGGNFYASAAMSMHADRGHVTVGGPWQRFLSGEGDYREAVRGLPIDGAEQARLADLMGGVRDWLDDLSLAEKYDYVNSVSYGRFLTERVGLQSRSVSMLDALLRLYYGFTAWNLSVLEAVAGGAPGLKGMGWVARMMAGVLGSFAEDIGDLRMFPDGNATVARLLVRDLVPNVAPGSSGIDDIAAVRFDYAALDRPEHPVRIRLESTAVGVRERHGEDAGKRVEVDYVRAGGAERVTAEHCVLACYNGIIPHLCPQLPEAQKEALRYGVKIPFVYANVLLKDGRAFDRLGATFVTCPDDPFHAMSTAPPIAFGGYAPPRRPDDPMAVFMMSAPTPAPTGGESLRDLLRMGRAEVYGTSFETYEERMRAQLDGVLGPYGLDHARDIRAITVNRLPHGYAYGPTALNDPAWPEGEAPHELGRVRAGRISIANSDAEARAYIDAAIDAAWRAVREQTG